MIRKILNFFISLLFLIKYLIRLVLRNVIYFISKIGFVFSKTHELRTFIKQKRINVQSMMDKITDDYLSFTILSLNIKSLLNYSENKVISFSKVAKDKNKLLEFSTLPAIECMNK